MHATDESRFSPLPNTVEKQMRIIGLISGTSMDAIDAVLVDVECEGTTLQLAVRAFAMLPFPEELRVRTRALLLPARGSTVEVCEVNVLLGEAFAQASLEIAQRAGVPMGDVDLVASHGQTVYHQVAPGAVRSTLQLGEAAVIAERTGCTVVAGFRPRDIAAGGQGAPLVPYLDGLVFRHEHLARAVQNIGGIGNVTYVPPHGSPLAFDTGPGNVLIDEAMRLVSGGTATYDQDGRLAATGHVDEALLTAWLDHPFLRQPPPKSTGREQWGRIEAGAYVAQGQARGLRDADSIATLTAFTARSIADSYRRYLPPVDEVLVSGGGARNPTLLRMLQAALPAARVRLIDELGLDADAKEAVAFALLGYATLHGWPNTVPSATGATHPVVLGNITPGANYRVLLRRVMAAETYVAERIVLI